MTDTNLIEFKKHDDIAIICFNRPEVHNSINEEVMKHWESYLDKIESDQKLRCIILTGAGSQTFSAGGDLRYFSSLKTTKASLEMSYRMQAINNRLANGKKVVIAAINGQVLGGGCEILTACHYRIAASHATFAFRQAPNGIITGWGGGKRLLKQVGKSAALRLLLTGERIDVLEAKRIGLIDEIVEPDSLLSVAINMAGKINKNYQGSIEAFLKLAEMSDYCGLDEIVGYETQSFADLFLGDYFRNILKKYS